MKYLYKIILLLFITSSLQANDNNISKMDNNLGWHYAVTATHLPYSFGYTSGTGYHYEGTSFIGLQVEKKYQSKYSVLLEASVNLDKENHDVEILRIKPYWIWYLKEDAYLFEKFYVYGAIEMRKYYPYNGYDGTYTGLSVYPMLSVGYGWHFFNHSLSLRAESHSDIRYVKWNNLDTGEEYTTKKFYVIGGIEFSVSYLF